MPVERTALAILAVLWLGFATVLAEPPKTGFAAGPTDFNREYFAHWLSECAEVEVRCIWFNGGGLAIGRKLTFDLKRQTVHEESDAPAWSRMGLSPRRLTHHQVTVVRSVTNNLPLPGSAVKLEDALSIAFQKDGKVVVISYDKTKVPLAVQRLFDIGGAEADIAYEELKPEQ